MERERGSKERDIYCVGVSPIFCIILQMEALQAFLFQSQPKEPIEPVLVEKEETRPLEVSPLQHLVKDSEKDSQLVRAAPDTEVCAFFG